MPSYLRQQKFPFGSLRKDPHWSTQGLVLYSQLKPAGQVIDETANKRHGVLSGAVWKGAGLTFANVTDSVDLGNTQLGITERFSFVLDGFLISTFTAGAFIFSRHQFVRPWLFILADTNRARFRLATSGDDVSLFLPNDSFQTGTKCHVVITWDQVTCRIYIDGIEEASQAPASPGTLSWQTEQIRIGQEDTGQDGWQGSLEGFSIYKRSLLPSEVFGLSSNPTLPLQQGVGWMGKAPAVAPTGIPILRRRRECA